MRATKDQYEKIEALLKETEEKTKRANHLVETADAKAAQVCLGSWVVGRGLWVLCFVVFCVLSSAEFVIRMPGMEDEECGLPRQS
eukprot:730280-Rhodomonas_salina.2